MQTREKVVKECADITLSTGALAVPDGQSRKKKPNILFIMTDQQSATAMSCTGNADVKTPAMDSLAVHGVRFEKSYTPNPICVPARTSIYTGLLGHQNGVDLNDDDLPVKGDCFVKELQQAGYETCHLGKWHVNTPLSNKSWNGFDTTGPEMKFDSDQSIATSAIDFMKKKRDKPFFLVTSFKNPHDICEQARMLSGISDRYKNGVIPPVPPADQCPELPFNLEPSEREPEAIRQHQRYEEQLSTYPCRDWKDDDKWRQYRWAYYRMCELVDSEIEKVLIGLKEQGLERDTVIVFTSDHGDGMGAHRWNQKTLFYEEVSRIPLIVSHLGVTPKNSVDTTTLSNIGLDLATTFLSIAGVTPKSQLKGQDLYAISLGRETRAHDFIVTQNHLHRDYGVRGEHSGRMLRDQQFKYVTYDGGKDPEQLFDIDADPGEMNNLAHDIRYREVMKDARRRLRIWLKENEDPFIMPVC